MMVPNREHRQLRHDVGDVYEELTEVKTRVSILDVKVSTILSEQRAVRVRLDTLEHTAESHGVMLTAHGEMLTEILGILRDKAPATN